MQKIAFMGLKLAVAAGAFLGLSAATVVAGLMVTPYMLSNIPN